MNRKLTWIASLALFLALAQGESSNGQLSLIVDQLTGQIQLTNPVNLSTGPVDFDYYQIESEFGALNVAGWQSLADQGFPDWAEFGTASNNFLGEANLVGSHVLPLGGSIALGSAFQGFGFQDLVFEYQDLAFPGELTTGIVQYVGFGAPLVADYNADGIVSHADYSVLGEAYGQDVELPGRPGVGPVGAEDFDVYVANYGNIASSPGVLPFSVKSGPTVEGDTQWVIEFFNVQSSLAGHLNIASDGANILSAVGGDSFLDNGSGPVGVPGFIANGGISQGISLDGVKAFAALGSTLGAPSPGPKRTFLTLVTEGSEPTTLTLNGEYGYKGIDYVVDVLASSGAGSSPENPLLPDSLAAGEYHFQDAASGSWFDPPLVEGFEYIMDSNALFTSILDFPTGFAAPFEVVAEGSVLGAFGPGESVDFIGILGHGVERFIVRGISPTVDAADPMAFPLKIAFDTRLASFRMVAIPEPSTWIVLGLGFFGLVTKRRRCI